MVTEVNAIHVREHGSLLAAAEKRALVWMAERLPGRVNSDHLTLLGFLAMGMAGGSYWAASRNPHALVLAVGTLYLLYEPLVQVGRFGPHRLFDVGGVFATAGLFSILVVSAVRNARALYRAETLP